jgi:ferric-dicitrate binding protein FerR (iron transport regulator)
MTYKQGPSRAISRREDRIDQTVIGKGNGIRVDDGLILSISCHDMELEHSWDDGRVSLNNGSIREGVAISKGAGKLVLMEDCEILTQF